MMKKSAHSVNGCNEPDGASDSTCDKNNSRRNSITGNNDGGQQLSTLHSNTELSSCDSKSYLLPAPTPDVIKRNNNQLHLRNFAGGEGRWSVEENSLIPDEDSVLLINGHGSQEFLFRPHQSSSTSQDPTQPHNTAGIMPGAAASNGHHNVDCGDLLPIPTVSQPTHHRNITNGSTHKSIHLDAFPSRIPNNNLQQEQNHLFNGTDQSINENNVMNEDKRISFNSKSKINNNVCPSNKPSHVKDGMDEYFELCRGEELLQEASSNFANNISGTINLDCNFLKKSCISVSSDLSGVGFTRTIADVPLMGVQPEPLPPPPPLTTTTVTTATIKGGTTREVRPYDTEHLNLLNGDDFEDEDGCIYTYKEGPGFEDNLLDHLLTTCVSCGLPNFDIPQRNGLANDESVGHSQGDLLNMGSDQADANRAEGDQNSNLFSPDMDFLEMDFDPGSNADDLESSDCDDNCFPGMKLLSKGGSSVACGVMSGSVCGHDHLPGSKKQGSNNLSPERRSLMLCKRCENDSNIVGKVGNVGAASGPDTSPFALNLTNGSRSCAFSSLDDRPLSCSDSRSGAISKKIDNTAAVRGGDVLETIGPGTNGGNDRHDASAILSVITGLDLNVKNFSNIPSYFKKRSSDILVSKGESKVVVISAKKAFKRDENQSSVKKKVNEDDADSNENNLEEEEDDKLEDVDEGGEEADDECEDNSPCNRSRPQQFVPSQQPEQFGREHQRETLNIALRPAVSSEQKQISLISGVPHASNLAHSASTNNYIFSSTTSLVCAKELTKKPVQNITIVNSPKRNLCGNPTAELKLSDAASLPSNNNNTSDKSSVTEPGASFARLCNSRGSDISNNMNKETKSDCPNANNNLGSLSAPEVSPAHEHPHQNHHDKFKRSVSFHNQLSSPKYDNVCFLPHKNNLLAGGNHQEQNVHVLPGGAMPMQCPNIAAPSHPLLPPLYHPLDGVGGQAMNSYLRTHRHSHPCNQHDHSFDLAGHSVAHSGDQCRGRNVIPYAAGSCATRHRTANFTNNSSNIHASNAPDGLSFEACTSNNVHCDGASHCCAGNTGCPPFARGSRTVCGCASHQPVNCNANNHYSRNATGSRNSIRPHISGGDRTRSDDVTSERERVCRAVGGPSDGAAHSRQPQQASLSPTYPSANVTACSNRLQSRELDVFNILSITGEGSRQFRRPPPYVPVPVDANAEGGGDEKADGGDGPCSLVVKGSLPPKTSDPSIDINTTPESSSKEGGGRESCPRIDQKVMVWTERQATARQVLQLQRSTCGLSAVANALLAMEQHVQPSSLAQHIKPRQRAEGAPLVEYLVSRSCAGTTHHDLITGMTAATQGSVVAKFFPMFPKRAVQLSRWLADWINKGGVCVCTLNLQRGVNVGETIPDAWHHQMVFGVGPQGIYLTNPVECVDEEVISSQLCSERVLLVRRHDVIRNWHPSQTLHHLLGQKDARWRNMNVLGQVALVLKEDLSACLRRGTQRGRQHLTSHVAIPAAYHSGITVFMRADNTHSSDMLATEDLPLLE